MCLCVVVLVVVGFLNICLIVLVCFVSCVKCCVCIDV